MRHTLIIPLFVFLIGCGKVHTSPEFFKPDDKCFVVVESSLSLNEKFNELLNEALKNNNNVVEYSNLKYKENFGITQENPRGHIAHIGGAVYGYCYIRFKKYKINSNYLIQRIIDLLSNKNTTFIHSKPENDYEYNARKKNEQSY